MNDDEIELRNIDPDDIDDVIAKVLMSFGIKFSQNDFEGVTNFGLLCDAVVNKINLPHAEGCASQQAFYKLREAIAQTRGIDKNALNVASRLYDIFPKKHRRREIKHFEKLVGFSLKMLKPKPWLINCLLVGLVPAVVAIFFNWVFGLLAVCLFIVCINLAYRFGKELKYTTLGEATKYVARENYAKARRNPGTINKTEVVNTIKELFMVDLYLPERALTREATF